MSWLTVGILYLVIGALWGYIEQLAYDDYNFFEFMLCIFLWLPRIVVWGFMLLYLAIDTCVERWF